ncbi:bifunctional 5,10-methylenetetrahydrofolate dehydrogenase/5,10-methenyltetrahydrofolate cyclohydrolase, partial [Sphingomonas bacterium]|uniref:bifunctional 5,10-methylenetetrahydrofolate dehydrogenase/5,10-methenyltetrahydrofolate cyclohydrolase n=1 Tax=Sphingomonas bacterium TaxID=1895847 RepID=UPI0015756E2E
AGRPAGLSVVLVGDDPASAVYVRSKGKATRAAGMHGVEHVLPADTTQPALMTLVDRLNADPAIDGILVQLPLPRHLDEWAVVSRIDPDKDVDGLHPVNVGRLANGVPGLRPCTPLGSLLLLEGLGAPLAGQEAVVLGRSQLVGRPVAQLLVNANCTVTVAHSRTRDVAAHVGRADIVIAAVGIPGFVKADWVKPGATVIDVGINRVAGGLVGDVDPAVAEVAGALTPVPGGVGPMTIACLLRNTLEAACRREGVAFGL